MRFYLLLASTLLVAFLGCSAPESALVLASLLARVHDRNDPEAEHYYPLYLGIGAMIVGARVMGSASMIHGKVVYRR